MMCWHHNEGPGTGHRPGSTDQRHAALMLAVINGFDPQDERSIAAPFGWDATRSAAGLRGGYVAADFTDKLDLAALDAVRRLGAAVIPLELPNLAIRGAATSPVR